MKIILLHLTSYILLLTSLNAQEKKTFTHADTLRGSITPERAWWDVLRYDITVKPNYENKTIEGKNTISFSAINPSVFANYAEEAYMQIDLQLPLIIDSVIQNHELLSFNKIDSNVWIISIKPIQKSNNCSITIYYHGKPREAIKPPWDGGWIWKKDYLGRPWMSVACQGLGASVWYPCKDIQSDEPDNGASLSVIVPDTLVAVGNGRLTSTQKNNDGTTTYKWEVKNPINNYNIIPYIGKYVNWSDTLHGEKGKLDLNYWVLDYDLDSAKKQFDQVKPMLHNLEHWYGPYPFYEDGYKLVQSPHLGMEHQSAVAYGNGFHNGYRYGKTWIDLSGTGLGLKWDFIIEHESSHEWFGNNITSKDLADMWIHESFANYSETLYTESLFGKDSGNAYNVGTRKRISNDEPIIAHYGVNEEGSGDMYYKGGNMLQAIRHIINNDEKWRSILRGLNKTFYHQTVTTKQIENCISKNAGIDFSKVFDQYLRTTQIPQLSYYYAADKKKVYYRWDSCVTGFNMQLVLWHNNKSMRIYPTQQWKSLNDVSFFDADGILKNYYIKIKEVK
ncbi:MAG: M1 family metallopeptidase [Parafilimonas sp.]|nr:M1 family metallopeptidase [Parafilimonas sp.]